MLPDGFAIPGIDYFAWIGLLRRLSPFVVTATPVWGTGFRISRGVCGFDGGHRTSVGSIRL